MDRRARQSAPPVNPLAICQAISEMRKMQGITGPLYIGMDTHALSEPAHASASWRNNVVLSNGTLFQNLSGIAANATGINASLRAE